MHIPTQTSFEPCVGGGGATFGVITSVTYWTYPVVPVVVALLKVAVDPSFPNQPLKRDSIEECVRISSALTDTGGGYIIVAPSSTQAWRSLPSKLFHPI